LDSQVEAAGIVRTHRGHRRMDRQAESCTELVFPTITRGYAFQSEAKDVLLAWTQDPGSWSRRNMKQRPKRKRSKSEREYLSSVTLMVLGTNLEPDVVSEQLKLVPSASWRRHERTSVERRDGTKLVFRSKHEWGGWTLSLNARMKEAPLEKQLAYWSSRLKSRRSGLRRLQARRWWPVLDIFLVTSATASIVLPQRQVKALASLGLDLRVSIWVAEEP
jgi:uncharacterized protein DUF4279